MLLKNVCGVVTGCNKGIGLSILENLSKNGADIFACIRSIDEKFIKKKEEIEQKYKNKIITVELDLSKESSVKSATDKINNSDKKINFIVNNSAVIHNKLFQMIKMEEFQEIFKINFFNQVLFTQGLMRNLIKKKEGSIIFLSSSSAKDGNIGRSVYSSSKSALSSFSKVLSRELGAYNIRVNSISPGLTNTEMMKKSTNADYLENILKTIPLKRIGEPIDVSNFVLFLVSDLSKYVTGQDFRLDGGLL